MPGLIALIGGNEFRPDCEPMDRALLARIGGQPGVVILPTAAARENPSLAAENGVRSFTRLGARACAAMVVDDESARDARWAALAETADLIYLTGGDPVHLLETLNGSPVWKAAVESWRKGRMLAGSSAGAMVMGGKMWAPGKGWREGLGLLPGLAVLPHHAKLAVQWDAGQMRSSLPEGVILMGIDEGTGLFGPPWKVLGQGEVSIYRGERPETFAAGELVEIPFSGPSSAILRNR